MLKTTGASTTVFIHFGIDRIAVVEHFGILVSSPNCKKLTVWSIRCWGPEAKLAVRMKSSANAITLTDRPLRLAPTLCGTDNRKSSIVK